MKHNLNSFEENYFKKLDNYILHEVIGEGAYGVICRATQESTGQVVAIKMLKLKGVSNIQKRDYQIARFERETRLCAEMNHPNIIKLLDKGYTNKKEPYAVFEYLSGQTLNEFIARKKEFSGIEISKLMGQVLDAIAYAHAKGIVHRDLKPQNIMVIKTGSRSYAKVLDFGIGLFTQNNQKYDHKSLDNTQKMLGTPAYCAPEQLRGEPPTVKSDLYAWGLILIECITGKKVMNGESLSEILQKQLSAENVPLPHLLIGHPLADILNRILMKNPARRAGNASTVYEEYTKIDVSDVFNKLTRQKNINRAEDQLTLVNTLGWHHNKSEKRQITVLCIKLSLLLKKETKLDLETFDTIQKDQLNLCLDVAVGYGGHIAGTLADNVVVYFGYPQSNDNDARMAGRTALELMNEVKNRNALLYKEHGVNLDIRMGINSGMVLSKRDDTPEGMVPNMAFNLLYRSEPGQVLVSRQTKKLLDPFLEFESSENGFLLLGERQTESLLFLNPRSAGRTIIGRDKEIKIVLDRWQNEKIGGKGIMIKGQAGIGKSKLIYEIKQQILIKRGIVHHCRCLPEHQNNALYPIFELLKKHLDIRENSKNKEVISKLEKALLAAHCDVKLSLPILCSWFSIPIKEQQESQISQQEQKEFILDILQQLIFNIGDQNKFLFIVEDLHWIDPTSESFLKQLLQGNKEDKCLIILSARPEFTSDWINELIEEIELSPLENILIRPIIEEILNGAQVSENVLQFISERTDGIALYAEELTYMLLEKKLLQLINGKYEFKHEIEDLEVPSTLIGLLQARLESVGVAMETAQLAATIGREFTYDLLVKSSLKDEAMVQADLDLFINANIIYRRRKVKDGSYMFRHALIRDAAFKSMTSNPRKEAHRRIAFNLKYYFKKSPKKYVQNLAYHFYQAEEHKEAIKFYKIAADLEMLKKLGHMESLNLTNKALSVIDLMKKKKLLDYDKVQEASLRIHKAAVLTNKLGWNHPEIIENYRLAESLLKGSATTNDKLEFALAKGMWIFECTNGNIAKMHVLTKKMMNASKALNNTSYLAQTYDCLSQTQFFEGDFKSCIRSCQRCYKIYNQEQGKRKLVTDGLDPYIVCKSFESLARLFIGEADRAIAIMEQTLEETESYNWPNLTMGIFAQTSRLYLYICSFLPNCKYEKEQLKKINPNTILCQEKGIFPYWESAINLNKISAEALSGKQVFFNQYKEARKKWAPKTSAKTYYDLVEVVTRLNKNEFDKALKISSESIEFARKHNVMFAIGYAYCFKAKALDGLNKKEEALKAFREAIRICKNQKSKWIELFVSEAFKSFLLKENTDISKYNDIEDIHILTNHSLTLIKEQNLVIS